MDYNYNYFNAYSDLYFSSTSFDLDITNPVLHNFSQPSMPDWSYLNQYYLQPRIMNKIEIIITTLHWVNRDTTPLSHIVNHHSNIQLSNFSSHNQPIEEKSEVTKSVEVMIKFQEKN